MIEQAGDIEEGIDGDAGSIAQWEARGGLFGHPGRDGQAAFGELDAERSPRLLIDEHRSKPLAHEGVIRVQDRDDLVTGIVSVASLERLSLRDFGDPGQAAKLRSGTNPRDWRGISPMPTPGYCVDSCPNRRRGRCSCQRGDPTPAGPAGGRSWVPSQPSRPGAVAGVTLTDYDSAAEDILPARRT